MDFERLLAVLGRHWRAVLVVLVVTAGAVMLVPSRVAPDYEVSGSAIVLSPAAVQDGTDTETLLNPWARVSMAETGAAAALVQVLNSEQVAEVVLADREVTSYTVTGNPANGAIVDIAVVGRSEASALMGFDAVLDRLHSELGTQQEVTGAPADTWMVANPLTRPTRAAEEPGSQTRAMVAVALLGAVAAIGVAIVLDVVVEPRRQRRREASRTDVDEPDDASEHGTTPLHPRAVNENAS
jgi:hypothetical protein